MNESDKPVAKIFQFTGVTSLDINADSVLQSAIGELQGCIVIGFDKDDDFYAASSYADGGAVLWLMELCKKKLLDDK